MGWPVAVAVFNSQTEGRLGMGAGLVDGFKEGKESDEAELWTGTFI